MPDASIRIDGRHIADQPRFGNANGTPVANLKVAAGRSRKNEQGGFDTLSEVFYDVSFWREHHDLIAGLGIGKGDTVVITGNVTGSEVYEGKVTVKVTGHGIQHFPKRDRAQVVGQAPRQAYNTPQQAPQQSYAPQQGSAWPEAVQPGAQQGGYGLTAPPF